jgi:hypothetical protein
LFYFDYFNDHRHSHRQSFVIVTAAVAFIAINVKVWPHHPWHLLFAMQLFELQPCFTYAVLQV